MPEHVATREDLAGPLTVRRGDIVRVVLDENPTTGFRWTVAVSDEAHVAQLGSDLSPGSPARPGAGGRREIRFSAVATGNTSVELQMKRGWSGEVADTVRLTLHIT
jgi:predicted secreted protein